MFLDNLEPFGPKQEFERGGREDIDVAVTKKVLNVHVDADGVIQRNLEHLKLADPSKLSQNKPGMLHVFEHVKANCHVEGLVRVWNPTAVECTSFNEVGNVAALKKIKRGLRDIQRIRALELSQKLQHPSTARATFHDGRGGRVDVVSHHRIDVVCLGFATQAVPDVIQRVIAVKGFVSVFKVGRHCFGFYNMRASKSVKSV